MFGNNQSEKPIMPIHHDRHSAFMTTAGSVAGEGLKGTAKGAVVGMGSGALVGAALFAGAALLLLTPLGGVVWGAITSGLAAIGGIGTGAGAISMTHAGVVGALVVGAGLVGAVMGGVKGLFAGGLLGGLFGAGKGMKDGHNQVVQERAAAQAVDQEMGAAQAQTQALMMQAQAARSPFPAHGHPMNMASPQISTAGLEHSPLAERQLQMA